MSNFVHRVYPPARRVFTGRGNRLGGTRRMSSVRKVPSTKSRKASKSKTKTASKVKRKTKLNTKATKTPIGSQSFAKTPKGHITKQQWTVLKGVAPMFYSGNLANRFTAGVGVQAVTIFGQWYNSADFWTMQTSATEGVGAQVVDSTHMKVQNMYFKSMYAEIMVTNQQQSPCHLVLYDIVSRKDIDNSSYDTPIKSWTQGLTDQLGTSSSTWLGNTPFQTQAFTTNYKVLRITDVQLTQGAVHQHIIRYNSNKILKGELLTELYGNDNSNAQVGGLTFWVMAVLHGYPQNDSTTKTQVSSAQAAVDYIVKSQYEFKPYSVTHQQSYNINNLPTSFSVGAEIVNVGSGAIGGDAGA